MATDDKNAKDLVKAVEKIAAGKAAKENQALASELDKTFSNLASVQEKLRQDNAKTAKTIKDGAAAELKANQEQQKSLQEIATSTIAGGTSTKDRLNAQKALEELNLNMQITADKAEATQEWQKTSAGQALAMKKQMEDQGQVAEDSKEFQKLSFKARQEDYEQRLENATSPAAKKQIKEDMRADAKKNGSRLDKIKAGIGGLFEISKKGMKAVALGGLALLSTLAIGGLLIALGKFLQSDTFKELTKYIQETLWPAILSFGAAIKEYFTGPRGLFTRLSEIYKTFEKDGFFAGIKCIFDNISGVEAIILAVAAAAFLPVGFLMSPFALKIAAVAAAIYILMELFDFADKEAEKLREKRKEILGKTDKQKAMFDQQTDSEYESGTIGKAAAEGAKALNKNMNMGGSTLGVAKGYLKNEIRKKAERDKEGTEIAKNLEQAILVRAKLVEKGMKNSVSKADKIIANLKKQLAEKDAENLKIDKGSVTNEKGVEVSTATGRDVNDPRTSYQFKKLKYKWDGKTMTKEDGTYVSGVKPAVVPATPTPITSLKPNPVATFKRMKNITGNVGLGEDEIGAGVGAQILADLAKSRIEREANAKSSATGTTTTNIVDASSPTTHNSGGMGSGRASLAGGRYGQLNRQEAGGMI